MRSLGADFTFNYKTQSYNDALAKYGPIDVYWVSHVCYLPLLRVLPLSQDNVGGAALEAAIDAAAAHARIVVRFRTPFVPH